MKKLLIFTFSLVLFTATASATLYTPSTVPMVHLQDASRYVCNPDGILSPAAVAEMDTLFAALEARKGVQTVVAVLESVSPDDAWQFTYDLFTHQGVGQKGNDNGLVIVLCTSSRWIQFVTGYGLEGTLPDAICKRVQEKYMNSLLAKGEWDKAMVAGSQALYGYLMDDVSLRSDEGEDEGVIGFALLCLLGFILFIALAAYINHKQKTCPVCKKAKLKQTKSQNLGIKNGILTKEVTYTCQNCGHQLTRKKRVDLSVQNGRGSRGGGFGGGFGGGGFGGGSFGGGRSGGGGAGSHF